jgi:hypothetical protein
MSDEFRDLRQYDRKECARMADQAIAWLWKRLGVNKHKMTKYQTHSEARAWLSRHPRLRDSIRFIFEMNKDRYLSLLNLQPGQCAAAEFLMGCSGSLEKQVTEYSNSELASEHCLSWDRIEDSRRFWEDLVADRMPLVRQAIAGLVDEDTVGGGRQTEKLIILAKAWKGYSQEGEVLAEHVHLDPDDDYIERVSTGQRHLHPKHWLGFGGIDLGPKPPKQDGESPQTAEDLEARKKEAREWHASKKNTGS